MKARGVISLITAYIIISYLFQLGSNFGNLFYLALGISGLLYVTTPILVAYIVHKNIQIKFMKQSFLRIIKKSFFIYLSIVLVLLIVNHTHIFSTVLENVYFMFHGEYDETSKATFANFWVQLYGAVLITGTGFPLVFMFFVYQLFAGMSMRVGLQDNTK